MHHPRSIVMRLYISRKCGGRGSLNVKDLQNHEVCSLREYFFKIDVDIHKDVVIVHKEFTPLSLGKENWRRPVVLNTSDRMAVWESKKLHGRFHWALVGPDVDTASSLSWLQLGEKLSKHLDLAHEITATWDVNATIIVPIVVSVNGLIAKSLYQHLKKLSLSCSRTGYRRQFYLRRCVLWRCSSFWSPTLANDGLDPCCAIGRIFFYILNVFFITIYI